MSVGHFGPGNQWVVDATPDQAPAGGIPVRQNPDGSFSAGGVVITGLGAGSVSGLTAGSTAAAAANTTAIQAALTAGGTVSVLTAGVIYINARLIYGSNTRLVLSPLATIRAVPSMNDTLLNSSSAEAFVAGSGGTTVTLTQGTGCAVNVAWTAHGLAVGDGVWLSGATLSTYNGVFRVQTVVDANNVTVYTTHYAISAPAGTIKAVKAVSNFFMEGGTWDYDYTNNTGSAATWKAHVVNLTGLIDSGASNVLGINGNKYSFCIGSVENFEYRNLRANNRSDGIKIYGPARSVRGYGAAGVTSDDFLSIQTKETAGFIGYQLSGGGDVYDVHLAGFDNYPGTALGYVTLYPSDSELMDRIFIEDVSGSNTQININTGWTFGYIGSLTLRNVNSTMGSTNQAGVNLQQCVIDQLLIERGAWWPGSNLLAANNSFLASTTATTVNMLIVRGLNVHGLPQDNTGAVLNICNLSGTFKKVIGDGVLVKSGVGPAVLFNFLSTFTVVDILLKECYLDPTFKYAVNFAAAPASGSPIITFENNTLEGLGVFQAAAAFTGTVVLGGNNFNGQSLAVVRHGGSGAVKIMSKGGNTFSSTALIATFSSATFTVFGNDLTWDTGLLSATKGQHLIHASAVAGRNAANQQGLCIGVDGTHFYALGTGVSGVNTLIL